MQCNIDSKGKAVRLAIGLGLLVLSLLTAVLIVTQALPGGWLWVGVGVVASAGIFAVFESQAGWCAVRAMGFKTRH